MADVKLGDKVYQGVETVKLAASDGGFIRFNQTMDIIFDPPEIMVAEGPDSEMCKIFEPADILVAETYELEEE